MPTEPPLTDDLGDVERLCTLGTRLARIVLEDDEPILAAEETAREVLRVAARLVDRLKGA